LNPRDPKPNVAGAIRNGRFRTLLESEMPESVYDPEALGLISGAVQAALREVESSSGSVLDEDAKDDLAKLITQRLLGAYDAGERNPLALRRAGLMGIKLPSSPRSIGGL
jgi:hypothetical protein